MLNRREFLTAFPAGATALHAMPTAVKPIAGSWFEFQHSGAVQAVDWNSRCARFTTEQWQEKVREIAGAGMKYLVLIATALHYRAFWDTAIYPKYELACADPIEAVLAAADTCGVKFFIGTGFYGDLGSPGLISDADAMTKRLQSLEELVKRYGHHKSFYGWYWPDETQINPHFTPEYMTYVNTLSKRARALTPKAQILIAPYGTRLVKPDDEYLRQMDSMDVDIMAYQDEIGVQKTRIEELPRIFAGLRKVHDRSAKAKLWADVEIFEFEAKPYRSPVHAASFERVLQQMTAVSPYVDEILIYQYIGLVNKPGTKAVAGRGPAATKFYDDYRRWRGGSGAR
ncbi:DUF4434 domain-containing protein [Terriglobus sp. TAA 43]|uniref:DUF4434 domain-containing protein n=1 Tax=Terriglobus sp. TAA 43 TaxID=278961 RepID=UPI000690B664|nr:DUF4434 domain-containing protein [Terriglobus sp. TAA 43]